MKRDGSSVAHRDDIRDLNTSYRSVHVWFWVARDVRTLGLADGSVVPAAGTEVPVVFALRTVVLIQNKVRHTVGALEG
jgi:hypothetical protein